jgi:hypothetical protein
MRLLLSMLLVGAFAKGAIAQSGAPSRVGEWSKPYPMKMFPETGNALYVWYEPISNEEVACQNSPGSFNTTFRMYLESAHVALIPAGPRRGQILILAGMGTVCAPVGQVPDTFTNATIIEDRTREFWIVDPSKDPPTVEKFGAPYTDGALMNLFCSGHSWLPDGTLFFAGGGGPISSQQGAFTWNPHNLTFTKVGQLVWNRYYPSVVTLWDGQPIVFGGTSVGPHPAYPGSEIFIEFADFERFDSSLFGTGAGPMLIIPSAGAERFDFYPRGFSTYDKTIFIAGDTRPSLSEAQVEAQQWECQPPVFTPAVQHVATYGFDLSTMLAFDQQANAPSADRYYGNSVIFERDPALPGPRERVFSMFGSKWAEKALLLPSHCNGPYLAPVGAMANSSMDEFRRDATNPSQWIRYQTYFDAPQFTKRLFSNSVQLPTGDILAIGGCSNDPDNSPFTATGSHNWPNPDFQPDLIHVNDAGAAIVTPMAQMAVPRLYHSCAILLPDGRVLTIGGGLRDMIGSGVALHPRPDDTVEVFSPPYLFQGPRPRMVSLTSTHWQYGASITATIQSKENLTAATRCVLMRPGSISHHFDFDQRHVTLRNNPPQPVEGVPDQYTIQIDAAPLNGEGMAPPGYYMLFVVSPKGVPSIAEFIQLR